MITHFKIKNFKIIKDLSLELANLNVLTGLNGSGKSSVIQALLLLRQSEKNGFMSLVLDGGYTNVGTQGDILHNNAEDEHIAFTLREDISTTESFEEEVLVVLEPKNKNAIYIPLSDLIQSKRSRLQSLSLFRYNKFSYLNAHRITPKSIYNGYYTDSKELGNSGEVAASCIDLYGNRPISIPTLNILREGEDKSNLRQQINRWLGFISPSVEVEVMYDAGNYKIGYSFPQKGGERKTYKAIDSAFGLTYVLPVITAILISEPGDLVIIENPEAHLHPAGQSKMGELFAIAAQAGVQIIIETHSDHILNGIRVAAKDKKIDADNIKTYYFRRSANDLSAEAISLKIDENGRIDKWPNGFFDEWDNMLDKLLM